MPQPPVTVPKAAILKAPFPAFGGKGRIADYVWTRLGDPRNFVEPFAFSAAVLLRRPTPGARETINDVNSFVANFWRAVQRDPEAVAEHADWPVNECLPAGTLIATPTGSVPVERVTVGMTVLAWRDGRLSPTTVIGTRRSESRLGLVGLGSLRITPNHPVWTEESGYIAAEHLTLGTTVRILGGERDRPTVDCVRLVRPTDQRCPLCGHYVPGEEAATVGTPVAGQTRWPNSPRLLDSGTAQDGVESRPFNSRTWCGSVLAGRRNAPNRATRDERKADELDRGRGRHDRLRSRAGTPGQVVVATAREEVPAGSPQWDAGQNAFRGCHRTDQAGEQWASHVRPDEAAVIGGDEGSADASRGDHRVCGQENGASVDCGTQGENRGKDQKPAARLLLGNRRKVGVGDGDQSCARCHRSISEPSDSEGMPLQGSPSHVGERLTVYNFQTISGNYFADGILVHNCDLHARHRWLVHSDQACAALGRVRADPEFYDAKIAGWWCWGACCWIGSGWCEEKGLSEQLSQIGGKGGSPVNGGVLSGEGYRYRPGEAVLSSKRPHLGGRFSRGSGVHANDVLSDCGCRRAWLIDWMRRLADRLRPVRVCCGHWSRVCDSDSTLTGRGPTAVFLDPPYRHKLAGGTKNRAKHLYANDKHQDVDALVDEVQAWCLKWGDTPDLRIAVCGLDGEYPLLDEAGWEKVPWKSGGGYGNRTKRGQDNAKRERIWFNRNCVPAVGAPHELSPPRRDAGALRQTHSAAVKPRTGDVGGPLDAAGTGGVASNAT